MYIHLCSNILHAINNSKFNAIKSPTQPFPFTCVEPCQPDQVTATGSCDSETMVVVAWAEAEGAVVYMVTAMGDLGYMTAFQTNESSLEAELPCGQTYSFTVIGQDESCDSPISDAAEFRTGTWRYLITSQKYTPYV